MEACERIERLEKELAALKAEACKPELPVPSFFDDVETILKACLRKLEYRRRMGRDDKITSWPTTTKGLLALKKGWFGNMDREVNAAAARLGER